VGGWVAGTAGGMAGGSVELSVTVVVFAFSHFYSLKCAVYKLPHRITSDRIELNQTMSANKKS